MARRELQEINAGSMADIAFLLLIFFLVTTTMDVDSGLARMLPPPVPVEQEPPPPVKERNVFIVLINKNNDLLVEGEPRKVTELKDLVKEFIQNPLGRENLSAQKEVTNIPYLGTRMVSKGIISLQNDRSTKYEMYIKVQNELVKAYNELRDELSYREFNKKYDDLDKTRQKAIKKVYVQSISEAEPKNIGQ